jgi:hypothetical protein
MKLLQLESGLKRSSNSIPDKINDIGIEHIRGSKCVHDVGRFRLMGAEMHADIENIVNKELSRDSDSVPDCPDNFVIAMWPANPGAVKLFLGADKTFSRDVEYPNLPISWQDIFKILSEEEAIYQSFISQLKVMIMNISIVLRSFRRQERFNNPIICIQERFDLPEFQEIISQVFSETNRNEIELSLSDVLSLVYM